MELMDRIYEAAILEFKDSGIKFTMDSLAHRLGISKRTLYETVPAKLDLMRMVIDKTFEDVKQKQKNIFEDDSLDTQTKLRRLFTIVPAYVDVLDYRRMNEIKKNYPELYKTIEYRIENDWELTEKLLEKAMDEGIIKRNNIVIIKLLLCEVFEQLINGEMLIKNNISYEEALEETISIIFDGLLV